MKTEQLLIRAQLDLTGLLEFAFGVADTFDEDAARLTLLELQAATGDKAGAELTEGLEMPENAEKQFRIVRNVGKSVSIMPSAINPGWPKNEVIEFLRNGRQLTQMTLNYLERDMDNVVVGAVFVSEGYAYGKLSDVAIVRTQ